MLVPSISGSSAYEPASAPSPLHQTLEGFKQLQQDLQAGNLSQAQADYAALSQNANATLTSTSNPVGQAFQALGQALQAGNLSGAEQAFKTLQQVTVKIFQQHHSTKAEPPTVQGSNPTAPGSAPTTTSTGVDASA